MSEEGKYEDMSPIRTSTWKDQESDFGAPDVDVLQLGHSAIPVGDRDRSHLRVHVVLSFNQLATVHLTHDWLLINGLLVSCRVNP